MTSPRRLLLAGLAAASLLGLPGLPGGPPRARADAGLAARYRCTHGDRTLALSAWFFDATPAAVVLVEGPRAQRLPQVVAASGARYSDGLTTFWVKGQEASWLQGPLLTWQCRSAG
jgi:membrane-bound inhibitor of C-type lysozyme